LLRRRPERQSTRLNELQTIALNLGEQQLVRHRRTPPFVKREIHDLQGIARPPLDEFAQVIDLTLPLSNHGQTILECAVGFSRRRVGRDGRPRYTAYYLDIRGVERSAGTFSSRKDADHAWQQVEVVQASGRPSDPRRGRLTLRTYVDGVWFPNHVMETSTRQSYKYGIDKHLMPFFGSMRMADILPAHVREWVTTQVTAGVTPAMIRQSKIILSAVFTTALNDFVVALHPCRGVKTPSVPVKEYRILTPEEFDRLYSALPGGLAQLLVDTAIESGLRWGELSELRLRDVHQPSGIVTVSRGVTEVQPKFHPAGGRFVIKSYPKGRRSRRFRLNPSLEIALSAMASAASIGPDDLLFSFDRLTKPHSGPTTLVAVGSLGMTEPNVSGRWDPHGALSAYTAGRCRCEHCRRAFAVYRATRRTAGLDSPRNPRLRDTDGHIPRDWFRSQVWRPACLAAGIDPPVRMHDLRHSHASWLLAGGADLQVVKERLGHVSIATTEKYLHTLPEADETALAALNRVRRRRA
jgi:integrase